MTCSFLLLLRYENPYVAWLCAVFMPRKRDHLTIPPIDFLMSGGWICMPLDIKYGESISLVKEIK